MESDQEQRPMTRAAVDKARRRLRGLRERLGGGPPGGMTVTLTLDDYTALLELETYLNVTLGYLPKDEGRGE